jgi:hypothetical protein
MPTAEIKEVFSVRPSAQTRQELSDLLPHYGNRSELIAYAIHQLWRSHFGDNAEPWVKGWDAFILARDTPCVDTGIIIPAGSEAWREVWSDGREGAVYSRAALEADGIL